MISATEGTMPSCSMRCTAAQPSSMARNRMRSTPRALGTAIRRKQ